MRLVRSLAAALLLGTVVLSAGASHAADAARSLDAAERAYVDLEYEKANKLASETTKTTGLTHEQLVRAYRMLARTSAILDRKDEARTAFVQLLTYAPDEKEDRNLPPKVTERQLEARGVLAGYGARPGVEISATVRAAAPSVLRVTTRDPTHVVKRVSVGWRWGGAGAFQTVAIPVGDQVAVDVAPPMPGDSRLDYFAQAFDDRDDAVFESGNPRIPRTAVLEAAPVRVAPAPSQSHEAAPRGSSFFASPVFWAIAGGVIVGGLGVYAVTRSSSSPSSTSLSSAVTCGGGRC